MHQITFTWHHNQLLKTPCTYVALLPNPVMSLSSWSIKIPTWTMIIHQKFQPKQFVDSFPEIKIQHTKLYNNIHHHLLKSRWSPLSPLKRKQANIPTRNPLPAFPAWQEWNLWATLRDCYTAKPVQQRARPARQYKSTNLLPSWFKQLVNSDFKCPVRDTALKYR